jgi:hypothetical protein
LVDRGSLAAAPELQHAEGRRRRGTEAEQGDSTGAVKGAEEAGGREVGGRRGKGLGGRRFGHGQIRLGAWLPIEEALLADQEDVICASSLRQDHCDARRGEPGDRYPGG